jgi:ComF family protein
MPILDLVFPKFCLGCGFLGSYLCPSCQKQLYHLKRQNCLYCQKASYLGLTHPGCLKKLDIDGVVSLFYYNNLLKKIIKNLKYRLATEVWKEFWQTINPEALKPTVLFKEIVKDGVIQPIPLTKSKLRERGFNQAELIAQYFQKFLSLPKVDCLVRKKETLSQAQLKSKRQRYLNLRGAFVIKDKNINLRGRKIVLVDDIITTGSTVKEATKVLKKFGARKIYVLTLARG